MKREIESEIRTLQAFISARFSYSDKHLEEPARTKEMQEAEKAAKSLEELEKMLKAGTTPAQEQLSLFQVQP